MKVGKETFPVTAITTGVAPELGVMFLNLQFLSRSDEGTEQSHAGRNYVLTTAQCLELARRIADALQKIETVGAQQAQDPKH